MINAFRSYTVNPLSIAISYCEVEELDEEFENPKPKFLIPKLNPNYFWLEFVVVLRAQCGARLNVKLNA